MILSRPLVAVLLAVGLAACGTAEEAADPTDTATASPTTSAASPDASGDVGVDPTTTDEASTPASTPSTPSDDTPPADPPSADPTSTAAATTDPTTLATEVLVTGLAAPWGVAFVGDTAYVTERDSGRLLAIDVATGEQTEVQTLAVDDAGEGGLLDVAAAPDGSGDLFLYLTTPEDNRVVRLTPGEEPEPILTGIPSARIHNGVGPDGLLHVGTGDAGEGADAQDPASFGGKVLRITPDGEIPRDNPDPDSPVLSLGHRNVQGLAFDADGRLWASEFGPDRDDEINVIEPGANHGWPEVTGDSGGAFADPVFVRQPSDASWSGGTIPSGDTPFAGDLVVGSLRGENVWWLQLDGGDVNGAQSLFVGEYGRVRDLAEAPDGSLWLLTSNRDGRGDPAEGDDRIVRITRGG